MRYFLILLIIITSTTATFADDVKGKIYGESPEGKKETLINATVRWLETGHGAYSGPDGAFELEQHGTEKNLIISYIGYKADTIDVTGKAFVEITLQSELETDEVVVTSQKPGQTISMSDIHKTEVITSRGLEKAACCNLSESFETNPSVDVSYSDAVTGAKQIELLGLAGVYTQIMMEKIPNLRGIASAYGLTYIPGSWMESISISKGAATVSTGYESITGQINVDYKKPDNNVPLFVNFYGNEHGAFEGNMNSSYNLGSNWSTMLLASGSIMNNPVDLNADSFLDEPMRRYANLMNRWKYDNGEYMAQFGVKALYEDREAGQLGFHQGNAGLYGIGIETQRYEAFAKGGGVLPGEKFQTLALITSAIYHKQNSLFGNRRYDADQASLYGNMIYGIGLGEANDHGDNNHNISTGVSYSFDQYDEILSDTTMNRTESVPGVFGEYTYKGIDDVIIVGGIRADLHNLFGTFITPRFHVRYNPSQDFTMRVSAGKGYRVTNIYAENPGLLASSRSIIVGEELQPEEAWNYGLNMGYELWLLGRSFNFQAEYYRTDFVNKVILDIDRDPRQAVFYNLDGQSYSNSFQLDLTFELIDALEIFAAYRLNDVWETYNGQLRRKPLQSIHKAFLNLAYAIDVDDWRFDYTVVYNGEGRLPDTGNNPEPYRLESEFPAFITMNAQITKKFGGFEFYFGGENLTNYRQPFPILAADNPSSPYFDSSMIWGPVLGRKMYAGIRVELD